MEREWLENMIPEDESCFDGWIPENILNDYLPGSIINPKERSAVKLAEKYGLSMHHAGRTSGTPNPTNFCIEPKKISPIG